MERCREDYVIKSHVKYTRRRVEIQFSGVIVIRDLKVSGLGNYMYMCNCVTV